MSEMQTETTDNGQMGWDAVKAASAETERERAMTETELVSDVIQVKIDEASLFAEVSVVAAKIRTLSTRLDTESAVVKATKAEIAAAETERDELISFRDQGSRPVRGEWLMESIFETNTVRYYDPKTKALVCERAMANHERQTEMQFPEGGVAADADAAGEASESEDDDANPEFDDSASPNITENGPDQSSSDVTDPEGVLNGTAGKKKTRSRKKAGS